MTARKVVDARGLMPPAPLQLTLEALDSLEPGGEVLLLLNREPFPLYAILQENGFTHRTESRDDGTFEIHITSAAP